MESFFRKEILAAPLYTVLHEPGIKLNQNESPWDVPLELKVAIAERLIRLDWNRYPLEEPVQLKKKVAKFHSLWADQVVLANGTNVLIQALVNATSHGSKVLTLDPSFSVYDIQARLFGNELVKVALNEDFSLPVEAVLRAIKKEKPSLIFIPNPNAPTGNLFEKQGLHRIVAAANCLTVIDEAYYPFSGETVVDWLKDFQQLVILRTFSKAFAAAGVRFGYAIADSEVALHLEKSLMPYCVARTTCTIIDELLSHPEFVDKYVKDVIQARDHLFFKMQEIASITVFPSHANFILFRVPHAKSTAQKLLKHGVVVRNVSNDERLKNCLRVTAGSVSDNEAFLKALRQSL